MEARQLHSVAALRPLSLGRGRSSSRLVPRAALLLAVVYACSAVVVDAAEPSPALRAQRRPAEQREKQPPRPPPQKQQTQRHQQQQPQQQQQQQHRSVDRRSMAGAAKGRRAAGMPDAVRGLVNPDTPAIGTTTATMEDLVLPFGYPLETYPVETPDGFVLRLYRIPYGRANATKPSGKRPAVLLHHGVTLSSACFVVLDPQSSMGFYLADAGFDVWMANTRANTYSRGHRHHRATDEAYWQHSMDELALTDLPAQIDFITALTGQPTLALVGHSQGCTLPLMLLAAKPEYNAKLWLLVLMGPVVFAEEIRAPVLAQQARTLSARATLAAMGAGQLLPNAMTGRLVAGCAAPAATRFCFEAVNFMFYGPSTAVSSDDFMRVAATWPATVAVRDLLHWSQLYRRAAGLAMFDFGANCTRDAGGAPFQESCNLAKYGQRDPPAYDLGAVTARVAMMRGAADVMATRADTDRQRAALGRAGVVFDRDYAATAHMDFIWARDPVHKADLVRVLWAHAPARA